MIEHFIHYRCDECGIEKRQKVTTQNAATLPEYWSYIIVKDKVGHRCARCSTVAAKEKAV